MNYPIGQTAVIVPVPAADAIVHAWRQQFDRSAPFGVPAHITVLYPFIPGDRLTAADLAALAGIFSAQRDFALELGELRQFPGSDGQPTPLYLAPEPDEPFRMLTSAVSTHWPEFPPYEGAIADPTPHLTVTEFAATEEVAAARRSIRPALPISTVVNGGSLIVFDGEQWREHSTLPFAR